MVDKSVLFKHGKFISHSGVELKDKIDCDALTKEDWLTNAAWFAERLTFGGVIGIPKGGLALAEALEPYISSSGPMLICDDVLTTGKSMEEARENYPEAIGVVLYSRTRNVPGWILPRFIEND